jgi:hypothetical protein
MLATWHPVVHGPTVTSALEASLHGRCLHVEHRCDEHEWRWSVRSARDHRLADGVACDAYSAERAAEDEVYRVHVPVGDAAGWWLET